MNLQKQPYHQFVGTGAVPASPVRAVAVCLVALSAGVGVVWWLGASSELELTGRMQVHVVPIEAEHSGRIQSVAARAGARVKTGDLLFVLANASRESLLPEKRRHAVKLEEELQRLRAQADVDLAWRLNDVDSEALETRLRAAQLLERQYAQQIERHAWRRFLSGGGRLLAVKLPKDVSASITPDVPAGARRVRAMLHHEATLNAHEVADVQIAICEQRLQRLQTLRARLPAQVQSAFGIAAAADRLRRARQALHELQQQPKVFRIVSPGHGTLARFDRKVGEKVAAGRPIAELYDTERRFIEVEVPVESLDLLPAGTKVLLSFDGDRQSTGRVAAGESAPAANGEAGLRLVRVVAAGRLWPDVPLGARVVVKLRVARPES